MKEEGTEPDTKPTSMKVLPPWMIKQGMVLTKEQRGEVKREIKTDQTSFVTEEKKPGAVKEDEKSLQVSAADGFLFVKSLAVSYLILVFYSRTFTSSCIV